jgi:disulfide bond formation protein DsbB
MVGLPWHERDPRPLLALGLLVAILATAGSLFLSEVWGLVPCDLCWYQRILIYPLVVVLGVALFERREGVYRTVLLLSVPGTLVAAYHSWIQASAGGGCGFGGGCGAILYRLEPLGLTVPNLSLVAFLLITAVGVTLWAR